MFGQDNNDTNQFQALEALANSAQTQNLQASAGVDGGQSGTGDTVSGTQVLLAIQQVLERITSPNQAERNPVPRVSNDGERVHSRDFRPNSFNECPSVLHERVLWLENMEMNLQLNGSGIKWYAVDCAILCRTSGQSLDTVPENRTFREIDIVIPYSMVFTSSKENCLVTITDSTDTSCLVPIPTRIWNALSAQVYGIVKPKIKNSLRTFYQNVSKLDGHALICALRSDSAVSISKTSLERLEDRAASISLPDLGEWTKVRGDFLQLIADWGQALKDGAIESGQGLQLRIIRKIICERFDDVLDGIAIFVDSHPRATVEQLLAHCDIICKSRVKALDRKRTGESTALYAGGSPPKYSRGTGRGGRGRGGRGNGKGKGKGKGTGKGKGKGQGKGNNNRNNYNRNNYNNNNYNRNRNNNNGWNNYNRNSNNNNSWNGGWKGKGGFSAYVTYDVNGEQVSLPPTNPYALEALARAQAPPSPQQQAGPSSPRHCMPVINTGIGQVPSAGMAAQSQQGSSGAGMPATGMPATGVHAHGMHGTGDMHVHYHGAGAHDEFQQWSDHSESMEHAWNENDDDGTFEQGDDEYEDENDESYGGDY